MSQVAAIGDDARLAGYSLAGVRLHPADDELDARRAWDELGEDVACLILTAEAHTALEPLLGERPELIWTVLPE